jgi:predicted house-cleaning noncanonical NTP pyrophosphatase (MazG superfamily)
MIMDYKEENVFEIFNNIYKEIIKLNPADRLAIALTILDESSEALGFTNTDINALRESIYSELGDIY